jgi:hypothetical protein
MPPVSGVHVPTHHTVPGGAQHLLPLPAQPSVPWRQQVFILRAAALGHPERGPGSNCQQLEISVSLQQHRLHRQVLYGRHRKAPRTVSVSPAQVPAAGHGELLLDRQVQSHACVPLLFMVVTPSTDRFTNLKRLLSNGTLVTWNAFAL